MFGIFITYIYQPFLNILVFFYWLDGIISAGHPDMGVAVIMLTIVIRILLLPLDLAEDKNEKDRREIMHKLHELEQMYAADPIRLRQESRKLFHRNRGVVIAEFISLLVQAAIALMLWKMFETGLPGEDIPLLYHFLPHVNLPFNLLFLGKYDLTHSNLTLNILQSVMIFLVETAAIFTSPYPPMKGEVVRLQLVLPVISFFVFLALPAGKKVFVITALIISLIIIIYKFIRRKIRDYGQAVADKELAAAAEALIVQSQPSSKPDGQTQQSVPLSGGLPPQTAHALEKIKAQSQVHNVSPITQQFYANDDSESFIASSNRIKPNAILKQVK